ncbi:MAG: PrsW family intramembrane metalloprotease, partial [Microbacterium sp.]
MSFGGQPPQYGQPPQPVYGQPPQPVYGDAGRTASTRQGSAGQSSVAGQSSAFDHPATRPDASAPATQQSATPGLTMPALVMPVRKGRSVSVWLFGILGFALLALIAYFARFLGTGASLVGLVLALVPLAIVLFGVQLIDRWEPEPKSLVVFALAWGAVAAVGISLLFDLLLTVTAGIRNPFFTGVIQAPFIEEIAKGLGVFVVFLIGRRAFDGPVDGVVYGALVGAGFAFTENIQYFGISLVTGGAGELTLTFILRGLVSPFAHAMFTALTGFAIGLAVRRGTSAAGALGAG